MDFMQVEVEVVLPVVLLQVEGTEVLCVIQVEMGEILPIDQETQQVIQEQATQVVVVAVDLILVIKVTVAVVVLE